MEQKIGIVGLGYIGLPLLAAFANVGYKVVGMDIDSEKVELLRQTFEADICESGLSETLKRCKGRIDFTTSYKHLMQQCSTVVITVNTPAPPNTNAPDFEIVDNLITDLSKYLEKSHLVILKSTVYPGVTRYVASRLEDSSGFKVGSDFFVAFSPERTIEGLAMYELNSLPKIVGGVTLACMEKAASILGKLGGKIIKVSSPEVAEVCKLVDNAYRAMNIAFANEIGYICEKIGIDAYEVKSAVGDNYGRTQMYLPGLGGGGPCLSKDPQILKYYANNVGIQTELLDAIIIRNKDSTLRIAEIASQFIQVNQIKKPTVSLIGLAFKGFPYTDDSRGSPAIEIQGALQAKLDNIKFKYYDPIVKAFLGNLVSSSLEDCIRGSNVVMFLTNHPALMNKDVEYILINSGRPLLIIDCWHSILNVESVKENAVRIFRIGGVCKY